MRPLLLFLLVCLGETSRSLDVKGCEFIALFCDGGECGDHLKDAYHRCLKLLRVNLHRRDPWGSASSDDWKSDEYFTDSQLDDAVELIHKLSLNNDAGVPHKRSYELFDEFTHSNDFDEFLDQYKPRRALDSHIASKATRNAQNDAVNSAEKRQNTDKQEDIPGKEVVDNVVTSDLVDFNGGKPLDGASISTSKDSKVSAGPSKVNVEQQVNAQQNSAGSTESQGKLILTVSKPLSAAAASSFASNLQYILWSISPNSHQVFAHTSSSGTKVTLPMATSPSWFSSGQNAADVANNLNSDSGLRDKIKSSTGVTILSATSSGVVASPYSSPHGATSKSWSNWALIVAVVGGSTLGLICAALIVCGVRRYRSDQDKFIAIKQDEAASDYQELCRTQMSLQGSNITGLSDEPESQEKGLVGGYGKVKKSWGEEPTAVNMDISTGHVVLAYMEDHLSNQDRLKKEWEALCNYKPESVSTDAGNSSRVIQKNRYQDVVPYDHTRVKLKTTSSSSNSDYINASFLTDVDPRYPAYIATQGPLDNTVADFWQMVWEQGVVVIVNLTQLSDMGLPQCHRYWPEDGSEVYHNFEVHLISEHIWCDDYLVRSFYLKNLQTGETRTVTQFHFLTWQDLSVPESPRPLLEFRRKVNKCYKGQSCPVVVHCNNGVGRTGTYILIDMVLNTMIKGAKEIDIAATLEHLRDQRQDMVKTKSQFEFALAAVAEEVTAILNSLPQ